MKKHFFMLLLLSPIFIATPFLISFLIQELTNIKSESVFSEARFFEEYYKLLFTFYIVLLGAWYAEYLLNRRILIERERDVEKFRSYFSLIKKNLKYISKINNYDSSETGENILDNISGLINRANNFFEMSSVVATSMNNNAIETLTNINELSNRLVNDGGDTPFNEEVLTALIRSCDILKEGDNYEL